MASGLSGTASDAACGLVRCAISDHPPAWHRGTGWYRETPMTHTRWPVLPVDSVEIYRQDVVVVRRGVSHKAPVPARGSVTTFTRKSRQRLAFVASNTDIMFTSMCTLTYPREFPNDGKDVKYNLKMFLKELRRKVPGVSILWFLEFQRRGAPHIHLLLRGVRVYRPMQEWTSKTWYRICATGDIKHLAAGTRLERIRKRDGARNYCVKYAHKMVQKSVPELYRNVGRFWGHSRDVKPIMRRAMQCTNDDLVGALESTGWGYLKGETIRYHTLYGAASNLTSWLTRGILGLSPSGNNQTNHVQTERTVQDGYQTSRDVR